MRTSFKVTVLGSSAAVAAHGRSQSALVLSYGNCNYLIDCGEGTQVLLEKHKISTEKLEVIFISHLHADHYLGVFGLISTMGLKKRRKDLKIVAPIGMKEIISIQLKYSNTFLPFHLIIEEVSDGVVFESESLLVNAFLLDHRVPTYGYKFLEKEKDRKLDMTKVPPYFSIDQLKMLKRGENVNHDHQIYHFEELTFSPLPSRSFAYASDTRFFPGLIDEVYQVDLLYHESTFIHSMIDRAIKTHHSTAKQAGMVARKADVSKLIIGHFSARYKDLQPLLEEAKGEFLDTLLASEGLLVEV